MHHAQHASVQQGQRRARDTHRVHPACCAPLRLLTAGTFGHALASAGAPPAPASDSPEAGFARDMSAHHAQAVHMSFPCGT